LQTLVAKLTTGSCSDAVCGPPAMGSGLPKTTAIWCRINVP